MVGSAVVRKLKKFGYQNIITKNKIQLDLTNQKKVENFFKKNRFDAVINAAAKVGGINANNKLRAEFIYTNLQIQNNIIKSCYDFKVKNLIFLGSTCVYPRDCKQPIKEKYLLTGSLEKTNEPYAIAKIAGIKLCESFNLQFGTNYKCLMPTNLYGPNDNYDLFSSHFFPALIRKIHNAKSKKLKSIKIWGSGKPKREMMFVDDLADACIFFLKKKTKEYLINIGSGCEKSILQYAKILSKVIYKDIKIINDYTKPDGTPRKKVNFSIAKKYGWKPKTSLEKGIKITYDNFLKLTKSRKLKL